MDTSLHTMENLFLQLGLDNSEASIDNFISHHQLNGNERLEQAPFWTAAQAAFIQECLAEDSDWVEVVDHLNAQLQK
ncbi:hypothetical protein A9Q78_08690 [Methylophaga sp. 41_12_T18]|mgnify:CR=1 FL=1|nr:hypothetical protein A9Q78_08690 [Methylophaga sp. 41_12_T18]